MKKKRDNDWKWAENWTDKNDWTREKVHTQLVYDIREELKEIKNLIRQLTVKRPKRAKE